MRPLPTEALLRRLAVLVLSACIGSAWAADCAHVDRDANAGGTGIGGTGNLAKGTGIGGTGIQLGIFRNEMQVAGNVVTVEGDVQAVTDGKSRPLASGAPVCTGDTITAPATASVQIRMADGGLVTLRPQTRLRIEKFMYRGTNKDASLLVLERGSCRIVTGNIGKLYPLNDLLKTPDATIGIREADHEATVILPGDGRGYRAGTYDKVNHGATFLANERGEVSIHPDQAGYANAGNEPTLLQDIPDFHKAGGSGK